MTVKPSIAPQLAAVAGILATQVVCLQSEGSVPKKEPVSSIPTLAQTTGKWQGLAISLKHVFLNDV